MRSTDILRSLVSLRIMNNDNKNFIFGTTMFQRNEHNLLKDFEGEIPIYLNSQNILNILSKLKLKKGSEYYLENLLKCYKKLIDYKILKKDELNFIKAWIKSLIENI